MCPPIYNLYPEIEPFHQDWLALGARHKIYYEECGNPSGIPVVFLHGGPGSGCNPMQRRFFDPVHYRVILFDQRGCGRSTPLGTIEENTTQALVQDIEAIRQHLNIDKWHVFGGSWGSTLALAYALEHHGKVRTLTLRGIFLSRQAELDWFLGKVQAFYPEVWQHLLDYLPAKEQKDVLSAYKRRIFGDSADIGEDAAIRWNAFESGLMRLKPADSGQAEPLSAEERQIEVARARVQIHYIINRCFIDGDQMLAAAHKLANIPTTIIQGRYDMVCPPQTAWSLSKAMPHAEFIMVPDAGHSATEPGITSALVAATEKFKSV